MGPGSLLRRAVKRLPPIRRLVEQRDVLLAEVRRLNATSTPTAPAPPPPAEPALRFPPGHYFSPIPALEEIRAREEQIFATPAWLPAVDMQEDAQLQLAGELAAYYEDQPFHASPTAGLRYHFENGYFQFADGLVLHTMLRHLKPRRVIEIGSGFSSALMMDTNQLFLQGQMQLTFIDPNPERLLGLLNDHDASRVEIIARPAQELDPRLFEGLEGGDILFVDSSHVSKVGSDVNALFFEILPRLRSGVIIHLHDIFHPFEYPKDWIYMGRYFTEAYLTHAFLMFNEAFRIRLSNSYLYKFHLERMTGLMPLWATKEGASLWLERV
jgi:predicted O-methyltransferase YrrM